MERKDIIVIITLFIVAFLVRYLGIYSVCMVGDEWLYWTKTNMIIVNNWVPVVEVFECSPPVLPHICALVATFLGSDLYVFRTVSAIFGGLTIPVIYLLGKEMYDRRVGLVAAIIMCFTAYHCFYSRIYKLEAFTLFLIAMFLYFFWLSECKVEKRYTYLAGIFLGLAVAAKYLPAFLVLSIPTYMVWIYGSKNIIKITKKLIIIYFLAFLAFLPLLIGLFYSGAGLQPFYYYTVGMFERGGIARRPLQYFTVGGLIEEGIIKMCDVLAYGSNFLGDLIGSIFNIATLSVFLVTIFVFFYKTLLKDKRSSFLFISLVLLSIVLLVMRISKYYLIYILPFYSIMAAHIFIKSLDEIKKYKDYRNIFLFMFIIVFVIYVSFVILTGMLSPYWDKGEYSWVGDAIRFIQTDSTDIHHKPIVIGTFIFVNEPIEYQAYLYNLSVEVYNLGILKKYPEETQVAIINQIDRLKPDYIIMLKEPLSFYGLYFKGKLKMEILKRYNIVYITDTYPYQAIILKRKNIVNHKYKTIINKGYVDYQFFKANVPIFVKAVKPYTVRVKIKNINKYNEKFMVRLHSIKFLIYIYHRFQNISLNGEESTILKYKILPLKKCMKKIPIMVDVYAKTDEGTLRLVDSAVDYIRYIK